MNDVVVEATGETVGEAKWAAIRELERLVPGLDRDTVRFEVVTEGERGLLGVGYSPAKVVAAAVAPVVSAVSPPQDANREDETDEETVVRELLERVAAAIASGGFTRE